MLDLWTFYTEASLLNFPPPLVSFSSPAAENCPLPVDAWLASRDHNCRIMDSFDQISPDDKTVTYVASEIWLPVRAGVDVDRSRGWVGKMS